MGYLVVHFVRHAQSVNKTSPPPANAEEMQDPDLSSIGILNCEHLSDSVENNKYITHILCSPMQRAISTTCLSFGEMIRRQAIDLDRHINIDAMPALQTLGCGPNGCGLDPQLLFQHVQSEVSKGTLAYEYLDVQCLMTPMWNQKEHGVWSPNECSWRVAFVKAALRGLLTPEMSRVEVVVVTHSSFLKEIVPKHHLAHAEMKPFLFERDSFELLTSQELDDLRRGPEDESKTEKIYRKTVWRATRILQPVLGILYMVAALCRR